jgi:hypothetical protein
MTVHLEEVIALGDTNARRAQRCAQVGIPVLAGVDVLDAIASVLDGVVSAE